MNSRLLVRLQKKHGSQRCRVELVEQTVDDVWQICKLRLNLFPPPWRCRCNHCTSWLRLFPRPSTKRSGLAYRQHGRVQNMSWQKRSTRASFKSADSQSIHSAQQRKTRCHRSSVLLILRQGRSCGTIAKMKRFARYSGASPITNAWYTSRQLQRLYISDVLDSPRSRKPM